jgi:DNA-binding transcriptional ArsR family regulator
MDVSRTYSAVVPSLDGDVLVVLAGTDRPLTGLDVLRLVKRGSERGVAKVLGRLTEQGLVHSQEAGRANLYSLNREHVAAAAVIELAGLRSEFLRRLRDAIAGWQLSPMTAALFGSAARGDGNTDSDIDLFIVRPAAVNEDDAKWREQLATLSAQVRAWSGNHAGIIEFPEADVPDLLRTAPPVLADLRRDGIDLGGVPLRTLLGSTDEPA